MAPRSPLFIIDGSALVCRAFFALQHSNMQTSYGFDTRTLFGVNRFITGFLQKHQPENLVVVFDPLGRKRDSFRNRLVTAAQLQACDVLLDRTGRWTTLDSVLARDTARSGFSLHCLTPPVRSLSALASSPLLANSGAAGLPPQFTQQYSSSSNSSDLFSATAAAATWASGGQHSAIDSCELPPLMPEPARLQMAQETQGPEAVSTALARARLLCALPAYKGQRPSLPDGLTRSVEPVFDLLRALGVPVLVAPAGFEADDVIASIVSHVPGPSAIASADKDFYQLLSLQDDSVSMFWPNGNPKNSAWLRNALGITPDQFPDVQALCGDAVDNVSGVRGIGILTACKLIDKFGSLEALLDHAKERALQVEEEEKAEAAAAAEVALENINNATLKKRKIKNKKKAPANSQFPTPRVASLLLKYSDVARLCKLLVTLDRSLLPPEGMSPQWNRAMFAYRGIDHSATTELYNVLQFSKNRLDDFPDDTDIIDF